MALTAKTIVEIWRKNWEAGFKPFAEEIAKKYEECYGKESKAERMACFALINHEKKKELVGSADDIIERGLAKMPVPKA